MNELHLVRLADVPAQPWHNGGGVTHELLAWPQAEGWLLRVSVATIAADGAFSAFAGIQRWLTLLEGTGVALELPDGISTLAPGDDPLLFPGEAAPMCRLLAGPTRDLNFMTQRAAGQSRMLAANENDRMEVARAWQGLYCSAPTELLIDGQRIDSPAACLAWSDRASDWQVCELRGAAWWLSLDD